MGPSPPPQGVNCAGVDRVTHAPTKSWFRSVAARRCELSDLLSGTASTVRRALQPTPSRPRTTRSAISSSSPARPASAITAPSIAPATRRRARAPAARRDRAVGAARPRSARAPGRRARPSRARTACRAGARARRTRRAARPSRRRCRGGSRPLAARELDERLDRRGSSSNTEPTSRAPGLVHPRDGCERERLLVGELVVERAAGVAGLGGDLVELRGSRSRRARARGPRPPAARRASARAAVRLRQPRARHRRPSSRSISG